MTQAEEEIEAGFKDGDVVYIDAIEEELQRRCGYLPKEAEAIVEGWEGDLIQAEKNAKGRH